MTRRKNRSSKGPPFIQMFRWVMASAAWKVLTPPEKVLYWELRARFNGHNNGMIGLGCREAAEAMNVGRDTANRAFGRLTELGFIEPTTLGQFRANGRRATEWLLTELPDDRTGHKAMKTFMSWRAETAAVRKKASPISSHVSPTSRTQTENRIDELTFRPTSRTQTARTREIASDDKDTSRFTTSLALGDDTLPAPREQERRERQHTTSDAPAPSQFYPLSEASTREPVVKSAGGDLVPVSDSLRAITKSLRREARATERSAGEPQFTASPELAARLLKEVVNG